MARFVKQNCEIGCPWKRKWVPGYYETDDFGRYLVGKDRRPVLRGLHVSKEIAHAHSPSVSYIAMAGGIRCPQKSYFLVRNDLQEKRFCAP